MEIKTILFSALGLLAPLVGLFGWSHGAIRRRMEHIEMEVLKRPTDAETRLMITDKLAPIEVEFRALSRRIDELKDANHSLDMKIDKLINMLSHNVK
jgi:hypothetical protein